MISLENLELLAESQVKCAKGSNMEFIKRLSKDPSNALEGAESYFISAARLKVWGKVLARKGDRRATDESVVLTFEEIALRNMTNGARWPKRSTDPSANLMDQCMTMAWAELYCAITETI